MSSDETRSPLNPMALSQADAARLLARSSGQPITFEMLQADLDDGASSNADGTINLVHYAAWLAKEMASGD